MPIVDHDVTKFITHETLYYVDPPPAYLDCVICYNTILDPMVCRSGQHTFCRKCSDGWLTNKEECPVDREELTVRTLKRAPQVLRDVLGALPVICSLGCGWVGPAEAWVHHLRVECVEVEEDGRVKRGEAVAAAGVPMLQWLRPGNKAQGQASTSTTGSSGGAVGERGIRPGRPKRRIATPRNRPCGPASFHIPPATHPPKQIPAGYLPFGRPPFRNTTSTSNMASTSAQSNDTAGTAQSGGPSSFNFGAVSTVERPSFSFGAAPTGSTQQSGGFSGFSFGNTPTGRSSSSSGFSFGPAPTGGSSSSSLGAPSTGITEQSGGFSGFSFGSAPTGRSSSSSFGAPASDGSPSSSLSAASTGSTEPAGGFSGFSFNATPAGGSSSFHSSAGSTGGQPSFSFGVAPMSGSSQTATTAGNLFNTQPQASAPTTLVNIAPLQGPSCFHLPAANHTIGPINIAPFSFARAPTTNNTARFSFGQPSAGHAFLNNGSTSAEALGSTEQVGRQTGFTFGASTAPSSSGVPYYGRSFPRTPLTGTAAGQAYTGGFGSAPPSSNPWTWAGEQPSGSARPTESGRAGSHSLPIDMDEEDA